MLKLLFVMLLSVSMAGVTTDPLERYKWQNRLLLVFAPSPENGSYVEQLRLLEDETAALEDRDLLVFHLLQKTPVDPDTPSPELAAPEIVDTLRERYAVPEGAFEVVLIGKDGGEKERYGEPVEPNVLYAVIDAMPMRRREMQGGD